MTIDIEKLRNALMQDNLGAFLGAGFGGAIIEREQIKNMSAEKLVELANRKRIDLSKYKTHR